jgi:hypothetical protein
MISLNKQLRLAAGLGLVGMALISAIPASAAATTTTADCQAGGGAVRISGQDVALSAGPGAGGVPFTGDGQFSITCVGGSHNTALVTDKSLELTATSTASVPGGGTPSFILSGADIATAGNPVITNVLTSGTTTIHVESDTPDLNLIVQTPDSGVGLLSQVVTGSARSVTNLIFAQTPELDSIALFGTGAVGMIGYAMMRMRAARGRRENSQ